MKRFDQKKNKVGMEIVKELEKKVEQFDRAFQAQCIAERNYEKLEMYIMRLLMSIV